MSKINLNENGINTLILDINSYVIKIRKVLYDIQKAIDDTKYDFNSQTSKKIKNKYKLFSDQYPSICDSLISYKKDMFEIKKMFSNEEKILSGILEGKIRELKAENNK